MQIFGKIDQLLVFLVFSITFLLISFGRKLVFSVDGAPQGLVKYVDPENYLSCGDISFLKLDDTIISLSGKMDLYVSLNGGQDFQNFGNQLELLDVQNPDLMGYSYSWHQKPVYGEFPKCKNLVVQLKSHDQQIQSSLFYLSTFDRIHSLPVLSLTMHQADVVGETEGIFVFGQNSWQNPGFYSNWWDRNGNFTLRGQEAERECHYQYFENGSLLFESDAGVRISGNATRGFPQKSFQLRAPKTGNSDKFDFGFFGIQGQEKYSSLVVRNSGNDNTHTMFADLVMQRLAEGTHVLTQQGKPVIVYLNGNYWGIYNIRERIDTYFLSCKVDAKEEDITILEGGGALLDEGSEKERERFVKLLERAEKSDSGFEILQAEIDILSFTDYILFETFFANGDWPDNNMICFKEKDGQWKWVLKDLDYGLAYGGIESVEMNMFDKLLESNSVTGRIFRILIRSDVFKKALVDRFSNLCDTNLNSENINENFSSVKNAIQPEIDFHIRRWRMIDSQDEWEEKCSRNLDFLLKRSAIYKKQILDL